MGSNIKTLNARGCTGRRAGGGGGGVIMITSAIVIDHLGSQQFWDAVTGRVFVGQGTFHKDETAPASHQPGVVTPKSIGYELIGHPG